MVLHWQKMALWYQGKHSSMAHVYMCACTTCAYTHIHTHTHTHTHTHEHTCTHTHTYTYIHAHAHTHTHAHTYTHMKAHKHGDMQICDYHELFPLNHSNRTLMKPAIEVLWNLKMLAALWDKLKVQAKVNYSSNSSCDEHIQYTSLIYGVSLNHSGKC